jgi:hypothetical protein
MKGLARTVTEKRFAAILLDAIDEAFTVLGPNVKLSIYFHLETKFAITKQDIPDRIEDFTLALEKIFGNASRPIEILIMKHLNQKVQCKYKWQGPKWLVPDLTFEKYVKLIRLCLEDKGKTVDVEVLLNAAEKPQQRI